MANEMQPLKGAIGLCRKAGKLALGFDSCEENVVRGRAQLILLASDLSPKTAKRVHYFSDDLVECRTLPLTQNELAEVAGRVVGVIAVLDPNLAALCRKNLSNNHKED